MIRPVPDREPLGVFHAVSTQDGGAQARDGHAFYAMNPINRQWDNAIVEIQFDDGVWMLASPDEVGVRKDVTDLPPQHRSVPLA